MSSQTRGLGAKVFLLKEMVNRDLKARYAGSSLGLAWAFALPVVWMLLYTGVFGLILRVPVPPGFANFPEFLMAGLLPWIAFHEGVSRSATALTDNAAMVKKTVFPLETLILSVVLAAVVNEVIALAIYTVFVAALGHLSLPWLLLAVPALLAQALLTFGLGCIAATVTVFLRDTLHVLGIALTVLFFTTPIVYPAALVPARLQPLLKANPLAHLTQWYRGAFTLHTAPDAMSVLYVTVIAGACAVLGAALFARARPHFADLI
ncbi:MAG: ABC transporter permease [Thermoanaerobaculia bacterium]